MNKRKLLKLVGLSLLLPACGKESETVKTAQKAMVIENGEECHLSGMFITNFPGPKGQLYERGQSKSRKFCSTRDMFAYLLDPEHTHNIQSAFVHDVAVTPWELADGETYIDARKAWYVVGHNRKGAMGPALASFSSEVTAKGFADLYGGKLYNFDQLGLPLISSMGF